ncbi:MAG TPA: hypothetical protein VHO46_14095, partial [Bacteroidales bacterium]|nr:hypothetical protein [Bacteroidales bacterium]
MEGEHRMKADERISPTIFVIFGGAGDLSWRKLFPALFDLSFDRGLPGHLAVIIADRTFPADSKLKDHLHDGVNKFSRNGKADDEDWQHFTDKIFFIEGDFVKKEIYSALKKRCGSGDALLSKEGHSWGEFPHEHFEKEKLNDKNNGTTGKRSSDTRRHRS